VFWPELLSAPTRVVLVTCGILLLTGNRTAGKLTDLLCLRWLERYVQWNDRA
jgi:hypothetical protein